MNGFSFDAENPAHARLCALAADIYFSSADITIGEALTRAREQLPAPAEDIAAWDFSAIAEPSLDAFAA